MTRPSEPRPPPRGGPNQPAGPHLSEEEIAVQAERDAPLGHPHLTECALCRARLALALDLLRVDGLSASDHSGARRHELARQLTAAQAADGRPARLLVGRPRADELTVEAEAAELFARTPGVALRAGSLPAPLGCRRRFGEYELEVELRAATGGDPGAVDLGVRLTGPGPGRRRAALLGAGRELSSQPLDGGRATFRDVGPGAYTLDVFDRRVVVGRVLLDVAEEGL